MNIWLVGIGAVLFVWGIVWMARNIDSNTAIAVTAVGAFFIMVSVAIAHDHNRPELTPWFKSLKSKGGELCCDGSDAVRVDDVDWESDNGKYRVRINGKWYDVPPEGVIEAPNMAGLAMVWPIMVNGEIIRIRCFIPGQMS